MEQHLERKFDEQFENIPTLKWLPWVGKNYLNTRLLIVGESHYKWKDDEESDEEVAGYLGDKKFTRAFINNIGLYFASGYTGGGVNNSV